ncbi:MAG TPA: WGR domain-containing protein, partial [Polyangium sp.]|nr:WGR domain-containing protein [Polyangium sp.]
MRRFEFVDGSSKKFWQIERDGSQLSIQWGKIGTTGQSQVKDFPSDPKAQAEHDKLIAEKTKKGYVEVAAPDASTAPAPAPKKAAAPAPAPAAPSATEAPAPKAASAPKASADESAQAPVVIDVPRLEDLRPNVHIAHRKGALRPTAAELAAEPWQAVQTAWAAWAPHCPWDQMTIPAELAPAVREVRAWLEGKGPTPISPLAAAVIDALLDVPSGTPAYPLLRALAEPSIAKDGPGWLIDAALATVRVRIEPYPYQIRNKEAKEFSGFCLHPETSGRYELDSSGISKFAVFTQNLSDDAYAALVAAVTTRWPTLSYWQKRLAL